MISYLCSRGRAKTISVYLEHWGAGLRERFRLIDYEKLPDAGTAGTGAFIFSDVERLDAQTTTKASDLRDALALREKGPLLLNHPSESLRRYDLLKLLHANGVNRFNVYRPHEALDGVRYPVFLREENEHSGALTPLLEDPMALERALRTVRSRRPRRPLLVVEYVDVGNGELFRKFSATFVSGTLIAHHIMFGTHWMVKGPSLVAREMLAEERAYQMENPHESALRTIFALARIDYGRIDYGLAGDAIQVWEINTNPTLLYARKDYVPEQLPGRFWFSERLNASFDALASEAEPS